jgi:formate-dependent nitrite reductase membrane component NrfD
VLAPLFLVSGAASGGAFLCLFLRADEHRRLAPISMTLCGVEVALLGAYLLNLVFGAEAGKRAGGLLLDGGFGLAFWGLVVLAGLLLPLALEAWELRGRSLPALLGRVPPLLKLTGSIALRFVIVYAGLQSFV